MVTAHRAPAVRATASALDGLPAFAEPVARLTALLDRQPLPTQAAVAAVEGDVALTLAVLRHANAVPGPWHGRIDSVLQAVVLLQGPGLREAIVGLPVVDWLDVSPVWGRLPAAACRHAGATARAADRLAVHTGFRGRDALVTAALLHDVGVLVLASPPAGPAVPGFGPERVAQEQRALGLDHAAAGALVLQDAGLPDPLVAAVGAHHAPDATGLAAYVQLADLLAHEAAGDEPDVALVRAAAEAVGISWTDLRSVHFDLPQTGDLPDRAVDPCPLSERELEVLVELARGSVYKQIAQDLSLSTSTVRTHLHNIYGKVDAVDRAQAVLIARRRGWL